ncbi:MAG: peroxiredoxin [Rhodobacteraceae bacterium]|nr:peroxiredoxin [Paracoccaceae bacterium]
MTIEVGDKLPEAELLVMGEDGPETVDLSALIGGRKVVLFGLPGAFTGTCSTAHLPSFIRTSEAFRAKGVDAIYCLAVNDPFVLAAWSKATGAGDAGITMLADPAGALTSSLGMSFTYAPKGFYGRSNRYAVVIEDGVVTCAHLDKPGECSVSTGESLLEEL